ncbi:MAG: L-histidine N(alpha)-methyltransferase [Beijerinckiaceae bacterium]|nr:L-histidine N(alpha)-methyltransferase [Beijerinckiaceae bacterium]MCI0736626.1 L-histidine N(alpha)-methyltransferase [Beijerinckiaceae bacterium]
MLGYNKALRQTAVPGQYSEFATSVIEGLTRQRKSLSCRYFYDARGSELFEAITRLPEYYPTRTEVAILFAHAAEIARGVPNGSVLVEFGSGSSRKTEILLTALPGLRAYVPIDVSESALEGARQRIRKRFTVLEVRPIIADFSKISALPPDLAQDRKLGFFPGSTIGNFSPFAAIRLLYSMRGVLSPEGRLIIGVDLRKDARQLVRAYNDSAGITAAFNLNLLARINRELEGTFDLRAFRHEAIYNPREGRIEMYIVSTQHQAVSVLGRWFRFFAGETIHTENSYKYSTARFHELAHASGWQPGRVWTDDENLFSVHELI